MARTKRRISEALEDKHHYHSMDRNLIFSTFESSPQGLTHDQALERLQVYGPNELPQPKLPGVALVFMKQFASPLIYVLIIAAIISIFIKEYSDAIFIGIVLFANAVIGTIQEYSAQKAASALRGLVSTKARVLRHKQVYELDATKLVPGDIVLLESGDSVPADLALITSHELEINESLLTGESDAVKKDASNILKEQTPLADRVNMAHAGTLVQRGRAQGIVIATALDTQIGLIAKEVLTKTPPKPPLMIRLDTFTNRVALLMAVASLIMASVAYTQGMALSEIFLLAVALAVAAIPEGLPVVLTVALAISMRRMAKRHVIVRQLVAVESLGSCTYIATDKTGTLTVNQLTAKQILCFDDELFEVTGQSVAPIGEIKPQKQTQQDPQVLLRPLCIAGAMANEATLSRRDGGWFAQGDALDVALLVMAQKNGIIRDDLIYQYPEKARISFESSRKFCASLNKVDDGHVVYVKGAIERLLPMCTHVAKYNQKTPIDQALVQAKVHEMAAKGYRMIALASGPMDEWGADFNEDDLTGLTLLGVVGMIDPLRDEAKEAIQNARQAGVEVAMISGDHPVTALAIAKDLNLATDMSQVVTGAQLAQASSQDKQDMINTARVFARVEPAQKVEIVHALEEQGHYVAMTGDGANDAPALRRAHVGIAMGKSGTDVARETSQLILTDDNFNSIVSGIEEGRIAYNNIRKVIYLLISTGAAELILFTLSLLAGLPIPLLPVQLLWLNLVTNGIQDVALAFEPGEGDELKRSPRSPKEPIFNRLMIGRVILAALWMGGVSFILFEYLLGLGFSVEMARNSTLLMMVLFENAHIFNSRSETKSAFKHSFFRNPFLLMSIIGVQGLHIIAMYTPWLSDVLQIAPVSLNHWGELLVLALTLIIMMEIQKYVTKRWFKRYLKKHEA